MEVAENVGIGRRPGNSAAHRQQIGQRHGWSGLDGAEQGIGRINPAQPDQAARIIEARHDIEVGNFRDLSGRVHLRDQLFGQRCALDGEGQIAAEDAAQFAGNTLAEHGARRTGSRDGGDAKSEAGQENHETAHAGAQFPAGNAQGQSGIHDWIAPSRISTVRSARLASSRS